MSDVLVRRLSDGKEASDEKLSGTIFHSTILTDKEGFGF